MAKVENKSDWFDRVAWGIVLSVFTLALISLYAIWVAASNDPNLGRPKYIVAVQGLWYVVSIAIVIFIMRFDSEQLFKLAPYAYATGIILLIAVLFLYNRSTFNETGAKSWFKLGPLTFQPSEVMKPAFILMLARVVNQHNLRFEHQIKSDWQLIGKIMAYLLPVAILLKLQNDFGTMLVFIAIVGGVILVSGITWKIIFPVYGVAFLLGAVAILLVTTPGGQVILGHFNFRAYQFERINSWLNPFGDTSKGAYQLWLSMKAIGSGQILGQGFGKINVYVPVRTSDMIFSVIGETFGFVGSCALIVLYGYLIFKMVRITFETKNTFYSYISTGIIMMILFHVFENIGMGIDLLPLTGIPLPFVSQGGSALIGNMIGVGLILSMKWHHKDYIFSRVKDF